jgi:hypothetical protein
MHQQVKVRNSEKIVRRSGCNRCSAQVEETVASMLRAGDDCVAVAAAATAAAACVRQLLSSAQGPARAMPMTIQYQDTHILKSKQGTIAG